MDMQEFDPQVAARVWQRVQAAGAKPPERPACPLEGIPTVSAVCKRETRPQPVGQHHNGCWLLLLVLLGLFCGK